MFLYLQDVVVLKLIKPKKLNNLENILFLKDVEVQFVNNQI